MQKGFDTSLFSENGKFQRWMEDHGFFEDLILESFNWEPPNLKFTFVVQKCGTYVAGTPRTMQRFSFETGSARILKDFDKSHVVLIDHCAQGFEVLDTKEGVSFELDTPASLMINCKEIKVSWEPPYEEVTKPWLSESFISITVRQGSLPTSIEWIQVFKSDGIDVVWRTYGNPYSESWQPRSKKYVGWYLQETNLIEEFDNGMFFFHAKEEGDGFSLSIENITSDCSRSVVYKFLSRYSDAVISCGNCKFEALQWKGFLETGKAPWD